MICDDVRDALDAYLDGELDAAEEAALHLHLEACPGCSAELAEQREWHGSISKALAAEEPDPAAVAESRRSILEALPTGRTRRVPLSRIAALLAIGVSVGVVAAAVGFSRPPEEQVARLVETMREQERRGARLQAVNREIQRDLVEARKAVSGLAGGDPAVRAIEVASTNLSRRLSAEPPDPSGSAVERLSITADGVTVVQKDDGRIRVQTPAGVVEARNMPELLARHPELCRRYGIAGTDGRLAVAGTSAGVDWKGRLDLLLRSGTWDETLQWEAYRGWLAGRARDGREIERRLREHQERCRADAEAAIATAAAVDVDAILKQVRTLTRAEIRKNQERLESELKRMEERLREASELRARARGLRLFAEDVGHD